LSFEAFWIHHQIDKFISSAVRKGYKSPPPTSSPLQYSLIAEYHWNYKHYYKLTVLNRVSVEHWLVMYLLKKVFWIIVNPKKLWTAVLIKQTNKYSDSKI